MPSGFTSDIYEGKNPTFTQFALTCARGMGALITMRDESFDTEIPEEFKPHTSYHDERLEAATATLGRLGSLSPADTDREAAAKYESGLKEWEASQEKSRDLAERYRAMLAEVEAWEPPTSDHDGLKKFMREQLEGSLEFDCHDDRSAERWKPKRRTGEEWRAEQLAQAQRDLAYHTEERAKEVQRAQERTAWVQALRRSLPPAPEIDGKIDV